VLDIATRKPLAGVDVALGVFVEPTPAGANPGDSFSVRLNSRRAALRTQSDANGRFSFESLQPRNYELRAWSGPMLRTSIAPLAVDGEAREVELLMPAGGHLVGRLIGPEGARFEGLALVALSFQEPNDFLEGILDSQDQASEAFGRVEADGRFRLGPLPAQRMQIALVFPSSSMPTSFNSSETLEGPQRVLGEVDIAAGGETQRDFDLRDSFPATLVVIVRVDGAPAASLVVVAKDETATDGMAAVSASTDIAGKARWATLPPATWSLLVRPVDSSWFWTAPAPLQLAAGEQRELLVDIVLVSAELTLVGADDGEPLTDSRFLLQGESDSYSTVNSDAAGRMRLRLPAGNYRITALGDSPFAWGKDSSAARLEWTASGPLEPTLRVARPVK
jgi:hypothetical protein